ncbi:MAG: PTS transporter subunit EIIC [Acidobacteriota bacterium]|nr:PTS transporter subunit EIIC [Acidobacteriota bacterium]
MAKNRDFDAMASQIIELAGGNENLSNVNHCATRLRLNVIDAERVDKVALARIKGVLGVELRGNECQIIVGQVIEDLYQATTKQVGDIASGAIEEVPLRDQSPLEIFSNFLMMMAGIMSPVIAPLIAAGLITVVLTCMTLFFGIDSGDSTYILLNNLAQTVFYYLPVYVAYTSAKKFGTEPVLAMVLAAWLLYPGWVEMAAEGGFTSYFGIPTLLNTYNGSVLQIIVVVWVMSKLDTWLKRVLPESIRHFMKPFLLLLVMSVVTLPIIAPLGALLTNYIYAGVTFIRAHVPWLAVPAIIAFSSTVGVFMPGFHLALIPIALQSIADVGYDDLINIWFYCCTLTPAFLALAVFLKTKVGALKQIAGPASLSAFFGISEPTTYGILYKVPKLFGVYVTSAFVTSIFCGIVGLKSYGFGAYSLTNVLLFMGPDGDTHNFTMALIALALMAVISFAGVFMLDWDDTIYEGADPDADIPFEIGG